jgi:hypothetical protein
MPVGCTRFRQQLIPRPLYVIEDEGDKLDFRLFPV